MAVDRRRILRVGIILTMIASLAAAAMYFMRDREKSSYLGGSVEARSIHVGSLIGGRVSSVHVEEGSTVQAGQLIALLESRVLEREIEEQKSAIRVSEAQLANVRAGTRLHEIRRAEIVAERDAREAERIRRLRRAGIVATQDADDATARANASAEEVRLLRAGARPDEIKAAEAQLEQQRSRLATLNEQRAESKVVANATGTVESFALRPGDIVAPNQTVAEIQEADQLWIRVYVPETELGKVRLNAVARVRVDTYPDHWFTGKVTSISQQGEYTPRNVQTRAQRAEQVFGVRIDLPRDTRLKPGMAAEVDLGMSETD